MALTKNQLSKGVTLKDLPKAMDLSFAQSLGADKDLSETVRAALVMLAKDAIQERYSPETRVKILNCIATCMDKASEAAHRAAESNDDDEQIPVIDAVEDAEELFD